MSEIKIKTGATVSNVLVRNEGSKADDSQVPAIYLKLACTIAGDELAPILGTTPPALSHFWLDNEGRIPAYPHLGAVECRAIFENCNVTLSRRKFIGCKVHKFMATFAEQQTANVVFTITFRDPADDLAGFLCRQYHAQVPITIESAQVDAFGEGDDDGS